MITDNDGNKITPKQAAKHIYVAFGRSATSGSIRECETHGGVDFQRVTDREETLIYNQLLKVAERVEKYLGI